MQKGISSLGNEGLINYSVLVNSQLEYFNTNITKDVDFRIRNLKKFLKVLKSNEELMYKAIYNDFKKSSFETYLTELSIIYHEIKLAIKKTGCWSKKEKVSTNLANLPGSSYIIPEPLGVTLTIGAWNYPYQLSILPAVSAMAAGNTMIVKPSELAVNTSGTMAKLINENFDKKYFHVVEGGVEETTALLKERFDKIFYTGNSTVGKIIMRAAAEHLTPVTLELGGKSPAFILPDAKLKITAKRIVWGKFINGGQTCVAPDYLLVHSSIKTRLIEEIKRQIKEIHGDDPKNSESFVRIINQRHFERLSGLIDPEKVVMGGETDERELYIAPTVMANTGWDDKVMKDEIFGPILPVIEFDNLEEVIKQVKARPKPLALYIFTNNSKVRDKIFSEISFGGGIVNDTLVHLANTNLPFGGVGDSGMGNYHGEYGFKVFSHYKSILHKSTIFEPPVKYPPYTDSKLSMMKKIME